MTRRLISLLTRWLLTSFLLVQVSTSSLAAEGIEIVQAHLESADEGYRLSATFNLDLNYNLEEALTRGIPLHFTTDVEMYRPRWYWFDEATLNASRTIRIEYNVLTRQYRGGVVGSVQQSFATFDDAMSLVRRPNRWLVAERGTLKIGNLYNVSVRMRLNLEYLAKPFQVNALNNSNWRLSSDWHNFSFRAE
ncbi:MAG: DUF4390 domain-containing protein [Pseudomonadota bacterium]